MSVSAPGSAGVLEGESAEKAAMQVAAEDIQPSKTCRCCPSRKCRGQMEPLSCWVTLMAAFCTNTLVAGLETSFPLFYDPLRDKYDASRASVGISPSLMISLGSVTALVCSPLINMFGVRPLAFVGCAMEFVALLTCTFAPNIITFHILYGVIGGVGYGLLYVPTMVIVQQRFTYNRGLATGIALLGFTAGTILAPILFEYLLRTYGLSGSLLLQCAIHSHNFIFAWAFHSPKKYRTMAQTEKEKPTKESETLLPDDGLLEKTSEKHPAVDSDEPAAKERTTHRVLHSFCQNLTDFSICRNVKFVLYHVVRLGWYFARFCLATHIVSAAVHIGVNLTKASYLPAIVGLANLALRSFSVVVLNFKKLHKELYFALGIVCVAAAGFCAASATDYSLLLAAMILVGCNEGISTASSQLVVVNLVGVSNFPKALSLVEFATLPAAFAAGPFSGWIVDISGDYYLTFLIAGVSGLVACVGIFVIIIMLRVEETRTRRKQHTPDAEGKELQILAENGTETNPINKTSHV